MKKIYFILIILSLFSCEKGIYLGNKFDKSNFINIDSAMSIIKKDSTTDLINVKGNIDLVCQSKGCWFTFVSSNGDILRVMIKDDAFLVPKTLKAKQATCFGQGKKIVFLPDKLKEIYSQAGNPKYEWDTISVPQTHYILETTAIFLE
jgi:hypothetical protein